MLYSATQQGLKVMKQQKKSRKSARKRMPTVALKRVVIEFPEPLLRRTEEAASALGTNRSELIRRAVEQFLKLQRKKVIQSELAAACEANAEFNRQLCEEFAYIDSENL